MEQSNPNWYESMQGNPLKGRTFTEQTAAAIKLRAKSQSSSRKLPRFVIAAAASVSVLMLTLFAYNQGTFAPNTDISLGQAAAPEAPAPEAPAPEAPAIEAVEPNTELTDDTIHYADVPPDQLLKESSPTDSEWLAFINELEESIWLDQYKDSDHYFDNKKMMKSIRLDEDSHYIFMKSTNDLGDIKLSFYDIEWGSKWAPWGIKDNNEIVGTSGWKQRANITHRIEQEEQQKRGAFESEYYRMDDHSIFVSMSKDPNVAKVRITDNNNNVYFAEIVANEDGYTYWHASTTVNAQLFTLESLDAEGNVLYMEELFLR